MKKLGLFAVATALACAAAPAGAAIIPANFDGDSGSFGNPDVPLGSFTDLFPFLTPSGFLGATINTIALSTDSDIDFSLVTLNDIPFAPVVSDGAGACSPSAPCIEFRNISGVSVEAGTQTIRVEGQNFGTSSDYNGTISFVARDVPEPAGWTTMVLALGLLGGALKMSRRKNMASATA